MRVWWSSPRKHLDFLCLSVFYDAYTLGAYTRVGLYCFYNYFGNNRQFLMHIWLFARQYGALSALEVLSELLNYIYIYDCTLTRLFLMMRALKSVTCLK
jgi:hypothetical protein